MTGDANANALIGGSNNTIALQPPESVHCHPCRMMHGSERDDKSAWTYCWKHVESGTAMCQAMITPQMMWQAISHFLFGLGAGADDPVAEITGDGRQRLCDGRAGVNLL